MTANLLSHTKLFKAGIALSGAFNRSLTPYGFQNEKRNYWGANKLYRNMSPFEHANKLNGAILLIHGGKDENTGTHTIQSERYFQALRGHNKYVRYVELPLDGHQYFIRENVLHYLYEANLWLEKYVKNGEPTEKSKAKKPNNND
jgi:dipeptidyl aminopeptidase/acylaminoacyl peptidase